MYPGPVSFPQAKTPLGVLNIKNEVFMAMQFKIGDKAVYPAHGVGVVRRIESKEIGGGKHDFYVLQILSSGATLMIPTGATTRAGMRRLISEQEVQSVMNILKSPGRITRTTWNRRFREFNDKLSTGSVTDVAEVLRDLCSLRGGKDLSFGEKKMLDRARSMIVSEISAACAKDEGAVQLEIEEMLVH
jgi:CarD family transcriptional regulator